jgi:methionyl-tRNA formyltransferase
VRLVFLGSPDFAVPSLRALNAAGHDVALVVTQPDRRQGRRRRSAPTPVKRAALALGLRVFEPPGVGAPGMLEEVRRAGAELGVVVAYGEILRADLLRTARLGFLNLHASLLPAYRGAAPINWAVMRGEQRTGVTVIRVVPRLDAGPVLAQREVGVGPDETAGELHDRLSGIGAELLAEVVDRLAGGEDLPGEPQPPAGGFYARKLTKADGELDWSLGAEDLRNRVRGLTPWPGAWSHVTSHGGRTRLAVLKARVVAGAPGGGAPGTVLLADEENGLVVQTGSGGLAMLELKPAGGRAMGVGEFLRGHSVGPGDRFSGARRRRREGGEIPAGV